MVNRMKQLQGRSVTAGRTENPAESVAVEENLVIIKRAEFDLHRLAEGDAVEVVNFVGGDNMTVGFRLYLITDSGSFPTLRVCMLRWNLRCRWCDGGQLRKKHCRSGFI